MDASDTKTEDGGENEMLYFDAHSPTLVPVIDQDDSSDEATTTTTTTTVSFGSSSSAFMGLYGGLVLCSLPLLCLAVNCIFGGAASRRRSILCCGLFRRVDAADPDELSLEDGHTERSLDEFMLEALDDGRSDGGRRSRRRKHHLSSSLNKCMARFRQDLMACWRDQRMVLTGETLKAFKVSSSTRVEKTPPTSSDDDDCSARSSSASSCSSVSCSSLEDVPLQMDDAEQPSGDSQVTDDEKLGERKEQGDTNDMSQSASSFPHRCAICLERWRVGDLVVTGHVCAHVLHEDCLATWVVSSFCSEKLEGRRRRRRHGRHFAVREGDAERAAKCPVCRQAFVMSMSTMTSGSNGENVNLSDEPQRVEVAQDVQMSTTQGNKRDEHAVCAV